MSFHATKVFTTFEGGAIVCPDEKTRQRINYLKNFGFACLKSRWWRRGSTAR